MKQLTKLPFPSKSGLKIILFLTVLSIMIQPLFIRWEPMNSTPNSAESRNFIVALGSRPRSLDPGYIQLLPDIQLMDANLEQFWRFDDSNDEYNEINLLGLDFISVDDYTIDVPLRQGVKFHDLTDFNAQAAKWNIDRFFFKLPRTPGTEPGIFDADKAEELVPGLDLSWVPISDDPAAVIKRPVCVLNNSEVMDTFTIRLNLNLPLGSQLYSTFRGPAMKMLSPTAHAAYEEEQLPMNQVIVGTGPFKMIGYDEIGLQAQYEAFDEYWRGRPNIDKLTYVVYADEDAKDIALFSGDVDFTYSMRYSNLESVEVNTDLSIIEAGVGQGTLVFSLNTLPGHIDLTLRKALSHAFPYDYIIQETVGGEGERFGRPIPLGKMWDNKSLPYPEEDIDYARQLLIDAGKVTGWDASWTDDDWLTLADSSTPVDTLKMPVLTGDNSEFIRVVIPQAFKRLGVNILKFPMTYDEFYPAQQVDNKTEWDILYQDWADFNPDSSSFLRSWYGEDENYNFANYYDAELQTILDNTLLAKTPAEKAALVYQAQDIIAERAYAYINVLQVKQFNAYRSADWTNVTGHFLLQGDFYHVIHVDDAAGITNGTTNSTGTTDPLGEGDLEIPGFSVGFLMGSALVPMILIIAKKSKKVFVRK